MDLYLENHVEEAYVDRLAERYRMSRTPLYVTVKKLTGKPPNEYIKEKQLYKAAELLREEHIIVLEMVYRVGISNPQYFATNFKKMFGVTPKEYCKGK